MTDEKTIVETFVKVEIRNPEPVFDPTKEKVEETDTDSKVLPEEPSIFYFQCTSCYGTALATNGTQLLKDPMDPMGDIKKYDVDYLFCPKCDVLENMKGKTFKNLVFVQKVDSDTPENKAFMAKKIRQDIFSNI